jgi:hypothetical protein
LGFEEEVKAIKKQKLGGGGGGDETDACRELGNVNSMIQTIWNNRNRIISAFEQNGSRIKRFRKPEQSDVDEALLKWFTQQRSGNEPVSDSLLMTNFVITSS